MATDATDLGWWAISGEDFLTALHRASEGEDPDILYAEYYVNSTRDAD